MCFRLDDITNFKQRFWPKRKIMKLPKYDTWWCVKWALRNKMTSTKRKIQRNSKARCDDVTYSKQRFWPKRKIMKLSEYDMWWCVKWAKQMKSDTHKHLTVVVKNKSIEQYDDVSKKENRMEPIGSMWWCHTF